MTKIEARRRLFVRWAHVSRCASCWQGGAYTGGDGCADGATSAVVQAIINENPTQILHFHAASSGSRKNNLYRFLFISMPLCRIMCGVLMCCPYGDDFRLCLFHVATGTFSSSYTREIRV